MTFHLFCLSCLRDLASSPALTGCLCRDCYRLRAIDDQEDLSPRD